jgi:sensor histidine kinase YesM
VLSCSSRVQVEVSTNRLFLLLIASFSLYFFVYLIMIVIFFHVVLVISAMFSFFGSSFWTISDSKFELKKDKTREDHFRKVIRKETEETKSGLDKRDSKRCFSGGSFDEPQKNR